MGVRAAHCRSSACCRDKKAVRVLVVEMLSSIMFAGKARTVTVGALVQDNGYESAWILHVAKD